MISLNRSENSAEFSLEFENKVLKMIKSNFHKLSFYPEELEKEFIKNVAKKQGILENQIVTGNGIEGLLHLTLETFNKECTKLTILDPSFVVYEDLAKESGMEIQKISIKNNKINKNELLSTKEDLMIIADPNNPLGDKYLDDKFLQKLSQKGSVIIIDLCYSGFNINPNKFKNYQNIIFLKSFSKYEGLAGIRLGFAYGDSKIIQKIKDKQKKICPFPISALSYLVGMVALEKETGKEINFLKNKTNFISQLKEIKKLEIYDNNTTSILINLEKNKISAKSFYQEINKQKIMIKNPNTYPSLGPKKIILGIPSKKVINMVVHTIKKIIN
ncbi:aminotransferase class I/II-fold pyridoxal phosphate-dependent enzyme [Candidatus Woesearchaeota archaeon]|jgi:histidinol-phosphate aminotransferase|nr:aminotransferase class I/II-fold pyridoxal phosphate-dependent enzyme [Candidatus Woesearchaeota archaeon]MBT5342584.1 aminotransferase class I/II-fold pyridoxal phosphate-dependent enzyme [Candidatus Woesearchaeota archaeon]